MARKYLSKTNLTNMCNVAYFLTTPARNEYSLMSIWEPGMHLLVFQELLCQPSVTWYISPPPLCTALRRPCQQSWSLPDFAGIAVTLMSFLQKGPEQHMPWECGCSRSPASSSAESKHGWSPSWGSTLLWSSHVTKMCFSLAYTNDVVTWASLFFGVTIFFAHFQHKIFN